MEGKNREGKGRGAGRKGRGGQESRNNLSINSCLRPCILASSGGQNELVPVLISDATTEGRGL